MRLVDSATGGLPSGSLKVRVARGVEQVLGMPLSFLGLAFFRAWATLFTRGGVVVGTSSLAHDAAMAGVLLVIAGVAARRPEPLASSRAWCGVAAACGVVASLAAIPDIPFGFGPGTASLVTAAIASALTIVLWCELFAYMSLGGAAVALALSVIGGEIVFAVCVYLTAPGRMAALVLLPVLSALMYLRARSLIARTPAGIAVRGSAATVGVPWRLLVVIALYYLASGACLGFVGGTPRLISGVASVAVPLFLIACVAFFPERFDIGAALRSPVPLLVSAILLLPLAGGVQDDAAAMLTALGLEILEIVVVLILCDISSSRSVPAAFLFGIEESLIVLRPLGEYAVSDASPLIALGVGPMPIALVAVALAVISTLVLLDRHALAAGWDLSLFGPGRLALAEDREAVLQKVVDDARCRYGLTPREGEIVLAILQGSGGKQVCKSLSIAMGTFKAHCEHVYDKVGVRSRRELVDALLGKEGVEGVSGWGTGRDAFPKPR